MSQTLPALCECFNCTFQLKFHELQKCSDLNYFLALKGELDDWGAGVINFAKDTTTQTYSFTYSKMFIWYHAVPGTVLAAKAFYRLE